MATKNLATVPGVELSEDVNFIAEVGGDINRVPYSLIENQIKAVNESIDGLNKLLGSHGTELTKLQSQFIYADTVEDLKFSTSNIGNNKTCTCFLSANCVQELTSNYSVAAKGYVSKPSDSMIDVSLMIGDQTLLFGRYDTSLSLFSFKETVNKDEYLELSNALTTLQGIVDGHTTDINTATQNIQTNAENIQANSEAIAENTADITQLYAEKRIYCALKYSYNIGDDIDIAEWDLKAEAFHRLVIAVPTYATINTYTYNIATNVIKAGDTTFKYDMLFKNDGTKVTEGVVDLRLVIMPVERYWE